MTRRAQRPCYVKRTLGGLVPADRNAEELIGRHALGTVLRVELKKPRNLRHHRLYWAMLALICDNLDAVRPETLHDLIKLRTGCVHVVRTARGTVALPGSIAFERMDQAAFRDFFDRAVDVIVTDVIPGLDRDDLTRELDAMIGRTGP